MIYLGFFDSFCNSWWLWWLLPFLLGLLLGWAIWAKWRKMYEDAQDEIAKLKTTIEGLESDLDACKKARMELESDLALERGRIREFKGQIAELEANQANTASMAGAAALGATASNVAATPTETSNSIAATPVAPASSKDNLQMIEGIGPKMEEVLNENGIHTFCQLADKSTGELRAILDKYGDKYKIIDPTDWIPQARAGCNSDWDKMIALQKEDGSESKAEKILHGSSSKPKASGVSAAAPAAAAATASGTSQSDKYAKLKSDNLQLFEGIGPKMNEILVDNGISSWSVLASKSVDDLKTILGKFGDKYRIIDPTDWPKQASFAAKGDWDGLIAYQKEDGSDAKAEKVMVKMGILKAWKQNDLKAVEGIGPKIEELLHNSGIKTWNELANAEVSRLQGILDNAGGRYKLADPGTWPKQAQMAADGKWDELDEYQEFLNGGKSPG